MSTLRDIRYDTCQHFIIAIYGAMDYFLLKSNLVAFYAKRNEIKKNKFRFALEVSFSIYTVQLWDNLGCFIFHICIY